jgi:hypothetical protein
VTQAETQAGACVVLVTQVVQKTPRWVWQNLAVGERFRPDLPSVNTHLLTVHRPMNLAMKQTNQAKVFTGRGIFFFAFAW